MFTRPNEIIISIPVTEQDIEGATGEGGGASELLEPGEYAARISAVAFQVFRKGSEGFVVDVTVEGARFPLKQYLVTKLAPGADVGKFKPYGFFNLLNATGITHAARPDAFINGAYQYSETHFVGKDVIAVVGLRDPVLRKKLADEVSDRVLASQGQLTKEAVIGAMKASGELTDQDYVTYNKINSLKSPVGGRRLPDIPF